VLDEGHAGQALPMTRRNAVERASVARSLLDHLAEQGVRHVFIVPGMQVDPLVKALANHPTMRPIVANHELAAGYMADGYARAGGGIGAAMAIGGPGCANLIGAAVAAKADRSPVLFITGNIPFVAQGRDEFQDAGPTGSNDVEVFRAAVGASLRCELASDLRQALTDASRQLAAQQPVHLAIAMDVQGADADDVAASPQAAGTGSPSDPGRATPLPALDWLAQDRVLLVAGRGALAIAPAMAATARAFNLPVASDTGARGIVPESGPHSVGHIGFMPHPRACMALDATGTMRAERVVALGCDDSMLATLNSRHPDVRAVSIDAFAAWLQADPVRPDGLESARRLRWLGQLADVDRPSARTPAHGHPLSYAEVVDAVAANMPPETCYVVDAGQVRRVAVARLQCRQPGSLFVAEGMAPMGWSLGAAIGARLACPRRPVVALLGDGAMRMHGIELATASRYRLPILYVLFDNAAYGSVLARMGNDAEADTARLPAADWRAFAAAFGVEARAVDDRAGLQSALAGAGTLRAPCLIIARVPAVESDAYSDATGIDWGPEGP
jgi:acetolactate synthase I/II/III large subunit